LECRENPAAGNLDPFFGSGGIVTTPVLSGNDHAWKTVVDDSDRILVGGRTSNGGNYDLGIIRLTSTGALDSTFGIGGKVTTPIGSGNDSLQSIVIDKQDRIVVSGTTWSGANYDFFVARFNDNGTLDSSFGTNGLVITGVGIGDDFAYDMAIDSQNRIVVAGSAVVGGNVNYGIIRLDSNGVLDNTFGLNGKITPPIGLGYDSAFAVAIDSSDRIIAAGTSDNGATTDFSVARFTTTGLFDTSFNGTGYVITPMGVSNDYAYDVAIDNLGRIVVAGHSSNGSNYDIALVRYNVNGSLDPTFDLDGKFTTAFGAGDDQLNGLAIDDLGRLIVGGYYYNGNNYDFALTRLLSSGSLDTSFDGDGKVSVSLGTGDDLGWSTAIDSVGRIILAGYSFNGVNDDFAVARFLTEFRILQGRTSFTYTEDDGAKVIDADVKITNSFNANLVGVTVSIGNYIRTQDVLGYTLQGGINASFAATTGVLTLSGSASVADYQAVLRSLTYMNTSQSPSVLARTITITANNGELTGNIATATYTIHVVSQNDAPTFTADAELSAILQGNPSPPGQKVAALFAGRFYDPDVGDTLGGIAVVGNSANAGTEGKWQYSTDNGANWFAVGAVADNATALALAVSTRIRFLAVEAFSGRPTALTVRAVDSTFAGPYTSGATRNLINAGTNGGTSPVSANTNTIETTVFPNGTGGNTPPTLLNVPISANVNEGQLLTFDADATDPDIGQALTYSLSGAPAGALIDVDTGVFTWIPTEAQGPNTFVFAVRVTDGLATTSQTVTVIVAEVNTAPVLSNVPDSATVVRGTTWGFTATASDSDIINGLGNTLTFSLIGAPAGASIHPDTGSFSWTPSENLQPSSYTFEVRVSDDGVPSKSNSKSITINVAAVVQLGGELRVSGTSGADTIGITPFVGGMVNVAINGAIVGTFAQAGINKIVARGFGGNDTITVSNAFAIPVVLYGGDGNDKLQGGSGHDSLFGEAGNDILIGNGGDDTYTFADAWGVDTVTELNGQGNDSFNFAGVNTPVTFTVGSTMTGVSGVNKVTASGGFIENLTGSAALDTLISTVATNAWNISGNNSGTLNKITFAGFENLTGSGGADTFSLAAGKSVTGVINGGYGTNTLDYSNFGAPVAVNLQTKTATGIGGFNGVGVFKGSSAIDSLTGADANTTWQILATNTGKAGMTSFSSFENLLGGALNDTFTFARGQGVSGSINGGAGLNTLNYSAYNTAVRVNLLLGTATGTAGVVAIANVTGGSANDILVGNSLANLLIGGSGRDILIGGLGIDNLQGGYGDDILIGGTTDHDDDAAALEQIMLEWQSASLYSIRADRLAGVLGGGLNGTKFLNATTIHDDGAIDLFYGNGDIDWFFIHLGELTPDRLASERLTVI
jgi:uncharacterized delta-60 repeat protein